MKLKKVEEQPRPILKTTVYNYPASQEAREKRESSNSPKLAVTKGPGPLKSYLVLPLQFRNIGPLAE